MLQSQATPDPLILPEGIASADIGYDILSYLSLLITSSFTKILSLIGIAGLFPLLPSLLYSTSPHPCILVINRLRPRHPPSSYVLHHQLHIRAPVWRGNDFRLIEYLYRGLVG